jgi:hypothetical protein
MAGNIYSNDRAVRQAQIPFEIAVIGDAANAANSPHCVNCVWMHIQTHN